MTVEEVWGEINSMSEDDIEDIKDRCIALLDALELDKQEAAEEAEEEN